LGWNSKDETSYGTKKDVIPCCSVPNEVKTIFLKLLEDKGKKKEEMNLDCGEVTR